MPVTLKSNHISFDYGGLVLNTDPSYKPLVAVYSDTALPTYSITDLPVDTSLFFHFADIRSTVTPAFFRFRASSNDGVSYGSYVQLSTSADWRTSGVWGHLNRLCLKNVSVPNIVGTEIATTTGNQGSLFFAPQKLVDSFMPASTNRIEFSFSTGNIAGGSTGSYNLFFLHSRRDTIV